MIHLKPSCSPSTCTLEEHARIVAAPITLLRPGAGPPAHAMASLLSMVVTMVWCLVRKKAHEGKRVGARARDGGLPARDRSAPGRRRVASSRVASSIEAEGRDAEA